MLAPPKLSDHSDGRDRLHTRPNVNLARSVSPINVEEQVDRFLDTHLVFKVSDLIFSISAPRDNPRVRPIHSNPPCSPSSTSPRTPSWTSPSPWY